MCTALKTVSMMKIIALSALVILGVPSKTTAFYGGMSVGRQQQDTTFDASLWFPSSPATPVYGTDRNMQVAPAFAVFAGMTVVAFDTIKIDLEGGFNFDTKDNSGDPSLLVLAARGPVDFKTKRRFTAFLGPKFSIPLKQARAYFKSQLLVSSFKQDALFRGVTQNATKTDVGVGLFAGVQLPLTESVSTFIEYGHHIYKTQKSEVSFITSSLSILETRPRYTYFNIGLTYEF